MENLADTFVNGKENALKLLANELIIWFLQHFPTRYQRDKIHFIFLCKEGMLRYIVYTETSEQFGKNICIAVYKNSMADFVIITSKSLQKL